ncbi:MAG: hypothetical protein BGO14_08850 [Chlamydiales bacterium 38-26]|nr:hypothetical protein [Chlamydiales bacterium]OJV11090.1 MAG: hypothetical protein BGO14_08850 [Chlamydiales bacterium 38-26]
MQQNDNHQEESVITISDLFHIFKTHRTAILFTSLFCCLIFAGFALSRPVLYNIVGTFKDKGKSNAGLSTLSMLLNTGPNQVEGEALATIKSRKFMEKLIYRRGLQGFLVKMEPRFDLFGFIPENLLVEYAHFMMIKHPVLPDHPPTIWLQDVAYNDEISKSFTLHFLNEEVFDLFDQNNKKMGQYELGRKIMGEDYAFTVMRKSSENLAGSNWYLELMPLPRVSENLLGILTVQADQSDRNLLHIKLLHPNRHVGTEILNSMMLIYQEHIREEQKRISKEQIAYLEKRQSEMGEKLRKMMTDHARNMAADISTSGFFNSLKAIEFHSNSQIIYQQKLHDIELAIRRLTKAQNEDYAFYDVHGDPGVINHILSEIRNLKQQSDSLDLALKNAYADDYNSFQETFTQQLQDLERVKQCCQEANQLLTNLDRGEKLPSIETLVEHPQFAVKAWLEKLLVIQNNLDNSFQDADKQHRLSELQIAKENFKAYLKNLLHILDVQEKVIEERLAFQQSPQKEFHGIDLNTSKELYINYNRMLNEVQAALRQLDFVVDQLHNPEFEITSMSIIQSDFVTNEMISKASQIVQSIKDQNNRSSKEIERLKEQLDVQKEFLKQHLQQAITLQKLKEQLIKEKIISLQSVTLGLLRQQISILDRHLQDYIVMRLKDLKQETILIEQHREEQREEMKDLPTKWMEERLIDQQLVINQKMVEEITSLVESKNLSSNLEILQSYPQDFAVPPLHPKSPRSILYAAFGAFTGAFLALTFFVVKSALFGIRVSPSNLKANHLHYSGELTDRAHISSREDLRDLDLDTLRRLTAYVTSNPKVTRGQSLLLLNGAGIDYSKALADLLAKRDLKVLLLPIVFKLSDKNIGEGLIDYLEKRIDEPKIVSEGMYDCIYEGGASRFVTELVASSRFKNLLNKLQDQYDWIVVVSDVMPASGQAEALLKIFDHTVVNLTHENISDLKFYMSYKENTEAFKKVSFVFTI